MEEWKSYKLSQISSFRTGKLDSNASCINGKYPFFTCSPETLSINEYAFDQKAVLLAGNNAEGIFSVKYYEGKFNAYQRTYVFTADESIVDPYFLFYALKICLQDFKQMSQGTSTKFLTAKILNSFEIQVPPLCSQKRIVLILKSIDDKIALNNRINHNLEEQAQALYKSWFVDFEPFKDGKFVDSELGMIPEGWHVGTLSELVEVRYGKDHKMLNDGRIPVYGSGGLMRYADRALFKSESVLIPRKGTLNNVMYVSHPFWTVDTMFYTIGKAEHVIKYAHLFLLTQDLASMNAGSAVPSMTTDILNKLPVLIPTLEVLNSFDNIVSSVYSVIRGDQVENASLASARDSILPQLMSGAIDINSLAC